MENIKKLPTEFTGKGEVKGFQFRQLKRGQKACLYEVHSDGKIHYEVFKIKIGKIPKSDQLYEQYPKANSFGKWAWTNRDYEKAIEKFKIIEQDEK